MNRFAYKQLLNWKNCSNNNFLILGGVSGVGKTTLIKDFISREFNKKLYFDMDGKCLKSVSSLIYGLEEFSVVVFDSILGDRTLLKEVFDLSKKMENLYFIFIDPYVKEGKGFHNIISARYLVLNPLSFEEFLFNVDIETFNTLSNIGELKNISSELNSQILNIFVDYLYVGGMPTVVQKYIEDGICDEIRTSQREILNNNYRVLSAYYKKTYFKNLQSIINTVFSTLIRDNQKFKLLDISASKRFTTFKEYFDVLEHLNILHRSYCLKGNRDEIDKRSFILYFFDTGILGLLGNIPYEFYDSKNILNNHILLGLCHNCIANELFSSKLLEIYQWTHNMAKIEFVIKKEEILIPVEFKNDTSGKLKSFDVFNTYVNNIKNIRLNCSTPDRKGDVYTYPIYLINSLVRKMTNLN